MKTASRRRDYSETNTGKQKEGNRGWICAISHAPSGLNEEIVQNNRITAGMLHISNPSC